MNEYSAPVTIDEFHRRIAQISGSLPKRLRQCAQYVAENTDRIAVSTVADLSEAADVQPSAFMRFCQLMGFSGFSEMQKLFRENYAQRWPDYATRLANLQKSGAGSAAALLGEFVEAGRTSLENLASSVDLEILDKSVEVLAKAPLIHIAGFRRAFPVASYLAYAFEKMDVPAILHDGVAGLNQGNAIRKNDALIVITFAPYSQETIALADSAIARDNAVIAITDGVFSPLLKEQFLSLTVSEVDVGAFRSLSASISLAMALAVAVGAKQKR